MVDKTSITNHSEAAEESIIGEQAALTIDFVCETVALNGRPLRLSPLERRLLMALVTRPEVLHRYEDLQRYIWGDVDPARRVRLHNYVCKLRRKLRSPGWDPIMTEQGRGYRFCLPVSGAQGR